jgi:hypothetical protein
MSLSDVGFIEVTAEMLSLVYTKKASFVFLHSTINGGTKNGKKQGF